MDAAPDFEALRARRNAAVQEMHQKMADEWGVPLQSLRSNFNPGACYCACATGGPCEHKWDGDGWEKDGMGRDVTAIYGWGMGVDVKRAAKTGAQKARERRARAKAEKLAAERALVRVGILKNFDED